MLEGHLLSERYKIKKTIGGGGIANVYLARDIILDRDVAIKVLRLEYANDEEFIVRFDREAKAATSLSDPNIVNIFDVGAENNILYMVMEYVDGLTLKEYIQKNSPIDIETALDIMNQVTSAIAHAHANDLVHRDIKPQNILIDKYGNVKVTDFGIAIALSATSLTQTNAILGSVHYLSPEQARGGNATKKSDIYSLGIVLFELLTGRLPFSGQTPVSIALKHLQNDTPSVKRFNPNVPQSVENIVLRATAKDPFHRYETVYDLNDAIETALHPSRINESVYTPPVEVGEETKAIPIITDNQLYENVDQDTVIHQTNATTKSFEPGSTKQQGVEDKKPKKKKKKKKKLRIILISIIVLLAAGILALFILPGLLQPKEVKIPDDLIGEEYETVVDILEGLNLQVEKEETHSDEFDEDLVVNTDPRAGRTVKEDSIVTVFVSQGKEPVDFDDYVGRDFSQVKRLLEDRGFLAENIESIEKYSDKPVGEIIAQIEPEPDSKVIPSEAKVIFEVSAGVETFPLNNLKGYTRAEAEDYLTEQGFKMNPIEENSEDIEADYVIKQHPEPNTKLTKGSTVDVYVSIGPVEKPPAFAYITHTVPYTGEIDEENENAEPVEQIVRIYIEDMNNSLSEVFKEEAITEDKEYTITLTIGPNQTAEYKVMRDDEVISNETRAFGDGE